MREILFRGKTAGGDWIEGFPMVFTDNYMQICRPMEYGKTVIPATVGQFTGLTDKNGKKIFEGDIVQGKDRLEKHLEVFGYIDHKNGSFVITGDFMTHYRWLDYDVEIIGNIHDNPELLEVTE